MNLKNKKVVLVSNFQPNRLPGVSHKIKGITNALQKRGYQVTNLTSYSNSVLKQFKSVKEILFSDAKHFIIRNYYNANILLMPIFIISRIQGKNLILDSPVPMNTAFNEKKDLRNKSFIKWLRFCLVYASNGPWSLWPFSKIIQYGNESWYYKLGNKTKTILLGNGIDVTRMPIRKRSLKWPTDNLKLVGVANVAAYHGFDRVIRAIAAWRELNTNQIIEFTIIGIGEENYYRNLKSLAQELNVQKHIHFLGPKSGDELLEYYNRSHYGISSLGLFRLKLSVASVLKAREYCLAGIPFIACGKDPDFMDETLPFRLIISNDDGIDDLLLIFKDFFTSYPYDDDEIHAYAVKYLSFDYKIEKIGL